jgi:hypothetical protein
MPSVLNVYEFVALLTCCGIAQWRRLDICYKQSIIDCSKIAYLLSIFLLSPL